VNLAFLPKAAEQVRGKLVLKPVKVKMGGRVLKATISLLGVGGSSAIQILDVEHKDGSSDNFVLQLEREPPFKRELQLLNSGSRVGFAQLVFVDELILGKGNAGSGGLSVLPDSVLLRPGERKAVQLTFGPELAHRSSVSLVVLSGTELARRVLRRARLLPGAARLVGPPPFPGLDMTRVFPGEHDFPGENFTDELAPEDVTHFYKKTVKQTIQARFPPNLAAFGQLAVEETLSESRLHLSTTVMGSSSPAAHSPPTTDAHRGGGNSLARLELMPRQLVLVQGGEAFVKMVNSGTTTLHWDLSWPASVLNVSPPAGE
jgi:hypothetical protein